MYELLTKLIGYPSTPTAYYPYDFLGTLFLTFLMLSLVVSIILWIFRR